MRLHCFHGFLGSESDFNFLGEMKGQFNIQTYDMAELCAGSKEAAYGSLDIKKEDIILGYSFGARFGLEAMARFDCKSLIMLAGHAGLKDSERAARLLVEDVFVEKVESLEFSEFMEYWNSIPLFKYDSPISPKPLDKKIMVNMFREFGLSSQKRRIDYLKENCEKVLWVCGKKDKKYYDYTKAEIEPLGVDCAYVEAGHRLLQNKEIILNILKKKLESL